MTTGESHPRPSFEFATATAAECVEHAVEAFIPELLTVGADIERRYLEEDYVPTQNPNSFTLLSVNAAVKDRALLGPDPFERLTAESVPAGDEEARPSLESFIETLLAHGTELGLTQELPSLYEGEGGRVAMGHEGPVASYSDVADQGPRDRMVKLDELFVRDPDFVREQIRTFHTNRALRSLGSYVRTVTKYHEVVASELLPELLKDIAALPSEVQESAAHSILVFVGYVAAMPGDISDQVRDLKEATLRGATVSNVLQHMSECGTQPEDVRNQTKLLHTLYAGLAEIEVSTELTQDPSQLNVQLRTTPYVILPKYQALMDHTIQNQIDRERADAAFVESVRLLETPEELLTAIQASWPDAYNQYVQLRDYLGGEEEGGRLLQTIFATAASNLRLSHREINAEAVIKELESQLQPHIRRDEQPAGFGIDIGTGMARITDSGLFRASLLLLASKYRQSAAAQGPGFEPGHRHSRAVAYRAIEAFVEQEFIDRAEGAEVYFESTRAEAAAAEEFRQSLRISDDDMEWLSILVDDDVEGNDETAEGVDPPLFEAIFYGLILERHQLIDMHSPAFVQFLRRFLEQDGELPASRAEKLRELGLE